MTKPKTKPTPRVKTAEQILDALEPHIEDLRRRREAKHLALVLLMQLQIQPDGIQCVCVLADASCKNNTEALTKWVGQQLLDPELRATRGISVGYQLLRRLNKKLLSLEAANS